MYSFSSSTMRHLAGAAMALSLCTMVGCDDDDDEALAPPRVNEIEVVSGTPQTVARSAASQPLVVRVNDQYDDPMTGVTVTWAITSGTGTLASTTSTTGTNGQAQVVYTAPATAGAATISATAAGLATPVTFTITIP